MSTFDVRHENDDPIVEIRFADAYAPDTSFQACKLERGSDDDVKIYDAADDYVYVNSAEHARNLIRALEKAINLGWLD